MADAHSSAREPARVPVVPRRVAFAAGALAIAAGVAAALVLTLTGGASKQEVLGSVTLDQPLAQATVEFGNGSKATTDAAGNFLVSTKLPKSFTVTTSGGTAAGELTGLKLAADYKNFDPALDTVNVDVLTTIVSRYRQSHSDVSVARAEDLLRKALALPSDLSFGLDAAFTDPYFSSQRFLTVAAQSGGFDALVQKVTEGMAQGREVGSYRGPAKNDVMTSVAGALAGKLVGNLMARAGLDPTTNALRAINSQLAALSGQIAALQNTASQTLSAVLQTSFDLRLDQLPLTAIRTAMSDLVKYTAEANPGRQAALRDHFEEIAKSANFNLVAAKFNDLLNPSSPGSLSVVQLYAKKALNGGRFFTPAMQLSTEEVFNYLDGMQVAAEVLYIEYVHLTKPDKAAGIAAIETENLQTHRADQIDRNPDYYAGFGTLDTKQKFWILNTPQEDPAGLDGVEFQRIWFGKWVPERLGPPLVEELKSIGQGRGSKTLKRYLAEDLGLARAMENVPEFSASGELWTASSCIVLDINGRPTGFSTNSKLAVSTNNLYARCHLYGPGAPHPSPAHKLYTLLVKRPERGTLLLERYEFLYP